jgi:hypothetical protein
VQLLEPGQTLTWAAKGADGRGPLETAGRWEQSSFLRACGVHRVSCGQLAGCATPECMTQR